MNPESAGEKAVAVGDVHDALRVRSAARERPGAHLGPDVDVPARVADDGRLALRSARRVNADDVGEWYGEEARRVVLAELRLDHERQPTEVVQRSDVAGRNSCRVQPLLVERNAVVRPPHGPAKPLELELAELRTRHRFDVRVPHHFPNSASYFPVASTASTRFAIVSSSFVPVTPVGTDIET